MPYLHNIGLENFRLFKEKVRFDLAPITILTGTNSSGKSSLIKSLQLFKQSVKETGNINELNFSGGRHNLGWFGQALNSQSRKKEMTFTFDFNFSELWHKSYIDLTYSAPSKKSLTGELKQVKIYVEGGEIIYQIEKGKKKFVKEYPINDKIMSHAYSYHPYTVKSNFFALFQSTWITFGEFWVKNEVPIKYGEKGQEISGKKFEEVFSKYGMELLTLLDTDIFRDYYFRYEYDYRSINKEFMEKGQEKPFGERLFKDISDKEKKEFVKKIKILSTKGINLDEIQPTPGSTFEDYFEDGIAVILEFLKIKHRTIPAEHVRDVLDGIPYTEGLYKLNVFGEYVFKDFFEKELEKVFPRIQKISRYVESLSSFRANTERMYSVNSEIVEINKLLWDYSRSNFEKWKKLKDFISLSLQHFGLGEDIKINSYQGVVSEILIVKGKKDILLADLGFGYSQLIPIILKVVLIAIQREKENNTINMDKNNPTIFLLEEPESNLHPSLQSKLADFLVLAARKFNIQFIVETHSEYMIRKFQYLTAKKELNPWDTQIYYFNHPDSEAFKEKAFKEIDIMEDGRLSQEFGEGFFDEADRIAYELYRMKLNNN